MNVPAEAIRRNIDLFAFAFLFTLILLPRAMLLSLVPVEALALVGSAQGVSALYFAASIAGITFSVMAPALVRRILLKFFELPAVFFASGVGMLGVAWLATYLPRRM